MAQFEVRLLNSHLPGLTEQIWWKALVTIADHVPRFKNMTCRKRSTRRQQANRAQRSAISLQTYRGLRVGSTLKRTQMKPLSRCLQRSEPVTRQRLSGLFYHASSITECVASNGKVAGELEMITKKASYHFLRGTEGNHRKPNPGVHISPKFDMSTSRTKS
jgi:hypothetical protein